MGFSFIGELSESHAFPSLKSLTKTETPALAEGLYLHLLGLRVLLACDTTKAWARAYARQTIQNNSYERWRTDATDLYVLLHGLTVREGTGSQSFGTYKLNPILVTQWLREVAQADDAETLTRRLFVRLDFDLKIRSEPERSLRRQIVEWPSLDEASRHAVLRRLTQRIQATMPRAEILPHLTLLSRARALDETASAGATGAASVATSVGGIGCGFDPNGHERSIYPAPKTSRRKSTVIRRPPV